MEGQAKPAYFVNEAFNHEEHPHGGGGGADNLHRRKSGGTTKELQLDLGQKKGQDLTGNSGDNGSLPNIDFDDILPLIGEFGRYQKILFICMIPFSFFVAFVYFSQIFLTLIPEQHWCHVPELDGLDVEAR
ncbi:GL15543 [Drosophila persimilis]|uniref:GL15543 n=2 Tax=Drosophila persimilis TaxID=7234 RepID=B4H6F0_DROPE|nr:GL15543 [Drosophila persimilis]